MNGRSSFKRPSPRQLWTTLKPLPKWLRISTDDITSKKSSTLPISSRSDLHQGHGRLYRCPCLPRTRRSGCHQLLRHVSSKQHVKSSLIHLFAKKNTNPTSISHRQHFHNPGFVQLLGWIIVFFLQQHLIVQIHTYVTLKVNPKCSMTPEDPVRKKYGLPCIRGSAFGQCFRQICQPVWPSRLKTDVTLLSYLTFWNSTILFCRIFLLDQSVLSNSTTT